MNFNCRVELKQSRQTDKDILDTEMGIGWIRRQLKLTGYDGGWEVFKKWLRLMGETL